MSSHAERLTEIVDLVLEAARRAGASDADAVGIAWTQSAAQVRLGEVETVTMSRERRLGLRCFDGNASAVASTADVSREMAAELLDVGAVYAECWPEGEGEGKPTRWRRIADRKIVAKGAPHPRHRPASSSSPSRDHL